MSKIQERAMLVSLSIGMFSPRKTDKKVTREVIDSHQASAGAGKFVKQILPEEALDQIKKLQGEARTYHYENTCPWTDEGARILPSVKYMDYVDFMRAKSTLYNSYADAFVEKFDEFVEQQRAKLNSMFNPADYPGKDKVRRKFVFKSSFLPFPDSADFRVDIADQEMNALREQMEQRVKDAGATARQDLWERMAAPLKTMAASLAKTDGRIYDSVVQNIKDIVALVPALNITGDPELAKICEQMRAELTCVSPETLRDSPSTRRETAAKANAILATMSGYLSCDDAPSAAPLKLPELESQSTVSAPTPLPVPAPPAIVTLLPATPAIDSIVAPPVVATPEVPAWRHILRRHCPVRAALP